MSKHLLDSLDFKKNVQTSKTGCPRLSAMYCWAACSWNVYDFLFFLFVHANCDVRFLCSHNWQSPNRKAGVHKNVLISIQG